MLHVQIVEEMEYIQLHVLELCLVTKVVVETGILNHVLEHFLIVSGIVLIKILDDKPVLIVLVAILLLVLHVLLPMKVVAILHILEEERVMVVGEQVK